MQNLDRLPERRVIAAFVFLGSVALGACSRAGSSAAASPNTAPQASQTVVQNVPADSGEGHLVNIRRVTNGGENAEAYWSADGQWITFQSTRDGRSCDQQYTMRADGSQLTKVSAGGKTTCGWFLPGAKQLFFASTHAARDSALPSRNDPAACRSRDTPKGRLLSHGSRRSITHGTSAIPEAMSPTAWRECGGDEVMKTLGGSFRSRHASRHPVARLHSRAGSGYDVVGSSTLRTNDRARRRDALSPALPFP